MTREGAPSAVASAATRGVIAAMAMTGVRRVTTGFGLVHEPPPEEVAGRGVIVSRLIDRVPPDLRDEVIELAHWGYGALGGAIFGRLWRSGMRAWWGGPVYGIVLWAAFEAGLVPLLGLRHESERRLRERIAVAADHVLYGVVVAGRPRAGT